MAPDSTTAPTISVLRPGQDDDVFRRGLAPGRPLVTVGHRLPQAGPALDIGIMRVAIP